MRLGRALGSLVVLLAACGPGEWRPPSELDSREQPEQLRPGYGNEALHMWWPLTEPEVAALHGIEQARAGDAHALLALAIFGSGDKRDAASYARYTQRFDQFIESVRADVQSAPDDAKRGELLNRAMHAFFFTGAANKDDPSVGAYAVDQARVTGIFDSGHYNCISSALLYTAIAREFSLPVRGVITKNHAFVELDPTGTDQRVDVETTSANGFGDVHDDHFYAQAAPHWKKLGLDPMTFDDYKARQIMSPFAFVAQGMDEKAVINDETQGRLYEAAAALDPDDFDLVYNRLVSYVNEARWLRDHKASRTTLRMVQVIAPVVAEAATKFPTNKKIMQLVAWTAWFDATALEVVGRGDEAVSVADDGLDHVDASWDEAKGLKQGFTTVLLDRMTELQTTGEYEKSVEVVRKHIAACRTDDACLNNLYLTFDGWCVKHQLAKDWARAKKDMLVCIALLPDDTRCHHTLSGLESLHPGQ